MGGIDIWGTSAVTDVSEIDEDTGSTLTFSIMSPPSIDALKISPCSGQILVKSNVIDYEAQSSYSLIIKVEDDG